jgi:aspartate-semialdehyde dehydrogenase
MSKQLGDLVVKKCVPEEFKECDIVFSGLDSDVAGDVGMHCLNSKNAYGSG